MPERYGLWKTCYHRFSQWESDETSAVCVDQVLFRALASVLVDEFVEQARFPYAGTHPLGPVVGADCGRRSRRLVLRR